MRKFRGILEPKHTVTFVFRFAVIVLTGCLVFGLTILIFLNKNIGPTYLEGIASLNQLKALLPYTILVTTFIQAVSLGTIALFAALFWSHSIAGPVFRFRRYLKEIGQGKSLKEPITFRANDQLHGLAQAFSEVVMSQKENSIKAQSLLAEAQGIIDVCEALKKEGKLGEEDFNPKLTELEKIYLKIKDIYN
ncbi:MAG: hypothetical protein Q7K98_07940 [Candidatus Omnitrophota bacterium]|nr:hypothetical protein [Candidatus Omnitrophota bacterium]